MQEDIKKEEALENEENIEIDESLLDEINSSTYPAVAMRGVVGFVYSEFNLDIGRDSSLKAIDVAMGKDNKLILLVQKDMMVERPQKEDLYEYGLLAEIKKVVYLPGGGMRINVKGLEKVEANEYLQFEPYIVLKYEAAEEEEAGEEEILLPAMASVENYFERHVQMNSKITKEQARMVSRAQDIPVKISLIANLIPALVSDKYEIFAANTLSAKLELLLEYFVKAEKLAELESQINRKVKESIDKGQQEYYLHGVRGS